MRPPAALRPLLLVPLLALAVACSDDDESSATEVTEAGDVTATTAAGTPTTAASGSTASGAAGEFCGPMEDLATYNAESPDLDLEADWTGVQEQIVGRSDDALELYGAAIDAAPDEVRSQLELLRDYSEEVIAAAAAAGSVEEFGASLGAPSDEILTATDELNVYIQETCGFGLTAG